MTPIIIEITGHPVAKGRARVFVQHGKVRGVTPKKTRRWEDDARQVARECMERQGRAPMAGPVAVKVVASFALPASKPAWWKQAAIGGQIAHTVKPDGDNILKAAKDALNGVAWLDDAQVVEALVVKRYDERPAVRVEVTPLGALAAQTATRRALAAPEVA